jgi:hypothetical protein
MDSAGSIVRCQEPESNGDRRLPLGNAAHDFRRTDPWSMLMISAAVAGLAVVPKN